MLDATLTQQLDENGFCVVPGALTPDVLEQVRTALDEAVTAMTAAGQSTHVAGLDPNASNVRVNVLPVFDPLFVELLRWPSAREVVHHVLGPDVLVSNFSANIALPGSGSMAVHSDQALVVPEPWTTPWAMNIIWCLDDVRFENGATLYLPGSHRFTSKADGPGRPRSADAPVRSTRRLVHRHGRPAVAHLGGQRRAGRAAPGAVRLLLEGLHPRADHLGGGPAAGARKEALDNDARQLLGLGPMGNARIGGEIVGTR